MTVRIEGEELEELSACFEVAEYKVEVKATITNEVRLSPLQAATAVDDPVSFVLCVVDLQNFDGDVQKTDWAAEEISVYCRLLSGQRIPVSDTLALVRDAESNDIPIRNASALRYAISRDMWKAGLDID